MSSNPTSERIAIGGHQHSRTLPECPYSLRQAILRDLLRSLQGLKNENKARHDKFVEKDLFNLIDSSRKIVDDFKSMDEAAVSRWI